MTIVDVLIVVAGALFLTTPSNWVVRWLLGVARGKRQEYGGAGRWIGVSSAC